MDWTYHPQMIIAISFISCFVVTMQGDGPVWAALVAAAVFSPIAALLWFIPYLVIIMVLATLLSLPQIIQAVFH
jgi:hypothetical protein